MLKNYNIICISSIDWDFLWQQHQEIMSTYAKAGNTVLFIENTGVRAPCWKDINRIKKRINDWFKTTMGFRKEMDNLYIYSPIFLPFPYSRIARFINRKVMISAIRNWMKSIDFYDPIIWTFLPTNITLDIVNNIEHRVFVYYCTDNFSATSKAARKITRVENKIIGISDVVFAMSIGMVKYCSQFNRNVLHVSMGINLEKFLTVRENEVDKPPELRSINGPIIGYVGGIRKSIDQDLVILLAKTFKNCTLVFVGPIQSDISRLRHFENIMIVEHKKHEDIPYYIKYFDCCIIPYIKDEYTDNVSPAKLNEYLIMGKPVVSTNLVEVEAFNALFGEVIYIAKNQEDFIMHITNILNSSDHQSASKRMAAAEANAWPKKIEAMSSAIERELEKKRRYDESNWKQNLVKLYITNRRRIENLVFTVAIAYSVIFYTPFVWFLAKPLKISQAPRKMDCIVVFAGGVGESGQAGQGYEERVKNAVELYKQGYAKYMLFSSGYTYVFEETLIMKELAEFLGVPGESIILEDKSKNTYENVKFSKDILKRNGWNSIILVSSPYHMRRVSLVFKKQAREIEVTYALIPSSLFYSHPDRDIRGRKIWKQINLRQIKAILHEYLGIVYYWYKGWI